jgi:hypothetical protein
MSLLIRNRPTIKELASWLRYSLSLGRLLYKCNRLLSSSNAHFLQMMTAKAVRRGVSCCFVAFKLAKNKGVVTCPPPPPLHVYVGKAQCSGLWHMPMYSLNRMSLLLKVPSQVQVSHVHFCTEPRNGKHRLVNIGKLVDLFSFLQ